MLLTFFTEKTQIENLFNCAPSFSEACLLFSNDMFYLWIQTVEQDLKHHFVEVANEADGTIIFVLLKIAFLW